MLCVGSQDGGTAATIIGELAAASVPALREQLLALPDWQASRIIIDLSGVTSCDAGGLAVLVAAARRAWRLGGILQLTAPAPPVLAALRLTGLDSHFEVITPLKPLFRTGRLRPARSRSKSGAPYGTLSTVRSAHSGAATRARRSSVAR